MKNLKTVCIYPQNSKVYNPAFDVTPNKFITSLITNKGIIKPEKSEIEKLND